MKIGTLAFVAFVVAISLLTTLAIADFAGTRVFFIIRRTIAFSVSLPSPETAVRASNGSITEPPLGIPSTAYTADIEFNVSNKSMAWVNASVAPCCANDQDDAIPIFVYTNLGSIPINITLAFNGSTMPPGVNVTASNSSQSGVLANLLATGADGCGLTPTLAGLDVTPAGDDANIDIRCKNVTNTFSRVISDLPSGMSRNLWLWAFFDNFPAVGGSVGGAYTRNLTHASQATDGV